MLIVNAAAVAVVLNGQRVAVSATARNVAGHIAVPLAVAERLARIVSTDERSGTIVLVREGERVVVTIGSLHAQIDGVDRPIALAPFRQAGWVFVPLAPLIGTFGGSAHYDAASKIVYVTLTGMGPLATMTPYVLTTPTVPPTRLFTPQPVETPRPQLEGSPRPRRTPIPAVPSRP